MEGLDFILNDVVKKLQSTNSVKKVVDSYIKSTSDHFNNEIDCRFMKDTFEILNVLRLETYDYNSDEELEDAFQNTLIDSNINMSNTILINELKELSKSDKLIKFDGVPHCIKISIFIHTLQKYNDSIKHFNELNMLSTLCGGIATYSNSNISECINPRISSHNETIYLNSSNVSAILARDLLIEFKDNSYEYDLSLNSLQTIGKENINKKIFGEDKIDVLFDIRKFLNASTPLKKEDFYKSAQISLLSLYKKYNFIDTLIGYKNKLSQSKVMNSINIIMENYFDMKKSSVYNACFTKPIQIKSYFFDLPIYEYRTKQNTKLHPVFENPQELQSLYRTIS